MNKRDSGSIESKIVLRYTNATETQCAPSKSVPITALVCRATKNNARPSDLAYLRERAALGVIEHSRYEQLVSFYNGSQSIELEAKAKGIMRWIISIACVVFLCAVVLLSLRA